MAAADESVDALLDGIQTASSTGEGRTDVELKLGGVSAMTVFCVFQNSHLLCGTKSFFRFVQSRCSHRASFRWHGR